MYILYNYTYIIINFLNLKKAPLTINDLGSYPKIDQKARSQSFLLLAA